MSTEIGNAVSRSWPVPSRSGAEWMSRLLPHFRCWSGAAVAGRLMPQPVYHNLPLDRTAWSRPLFALKGNSRILMRGARTLRETSLQCQTGSLSEHGGHRAQACSHSTWLNLTASIRKPRAMPSLIVSTLSIRARPTDTMSRTASPRTRSGVSEPRNTLAREPAHDGGERVATTATMTAPRDPTGDSPARNRGANVRSMRDCLPMPSRSSPNRAAPKNSFRQPVQTDHPCPAPPFKDSAFFLSEIVVSCHHPVSIRGALRGRHGR